MRGDDKTKAWVSRKHGVLGNSVSGDFKGGVRSGPLGVTLSNRLHHNLKIE